MILVPRGIHSWGHPMQKLYKPSETKLAIHSSDPIVKNHMSRYSN